MPSIGPPVGPYAAATISGGWIFVSGQSSLNEFNEVVGIGDIVAQTGTTLDRVSTILGECGAGLRDVVFATVYLTNKEHYGLFNRAWADRFGDHLPARAVVVAGLVMKELLVEIHVTAVARPTESG